MAPTVSHAPQWGVWTSAAARGHPARAVLRRSLLCATIVARLAAAGDALAQGWPMADPWFTAPTPPGPSEPTSGIERRERVIERAVAAIASGRGPSVVAALEAELRRGGHARGGYDVVAVLLRLASGAMPAARVSAPDGRGLPPPPTDREATERSVDGAVELLIRGERESATAWLASALTARTSLDEDHPLRVLWRITDRMSPAPQAPSPRRTPATRSARGGRPEGTIDGTEAVTLIGIGGTYGLTLGVWVAVGVEEARGDAGVAQILVPMAGVGAGMITAGVLDELRVVRRGRAYAANAGFYLGLLGAFGADLLADSPLRDSSPFGRASAYFGAATVGIGAGIGVAHATDALPGSAAFTLSGGVWGALVGASLDRGFRNDHLESPGLGLLVGEAIGAAAAMVTSRWLRPTPGQTRWLDLGAIGGFLAGVLVTSGADNPQATSLAAGLGCIAGGTLGYVLGAPSDPLAAPARASRSLRVTPTFQALPGGGVFGVAM